VPHSDYRLYGLNIRSDIELPARTGSATVPDLTITRGATRPVPSRPEPGEVMVELALGDEGGHSLTRTTSGYVSRFYGTADFHYTPDLARITAHAADAASEPLLPILTASSVPAFHLLMRGNVVLHGSAVEQDGRAVALLGPSGAGKSTIAAALCNAGLALVTDDVLALDWRGDRPHVRLGPTELRAREGSVGLRDWQGPPPRRTADGRLALTPRLAASPPELAVIVIPELDASATDFAVTRMAAAEAFTGILANLRTQMTQADVMRRLFEEKARLSRSVPIFRVTVPATRRGALAGAVHLITELLVTPTDAVRASQ
jgi:hypothetical protein